MKKVIALLLALAMAALSGCGNAENSQEGEFKAGENGVVKVYNWGDYIDEEVIDLFEKETGIEVVYDLFENNEEMYPIIEAGGRVYDAVCPSDYMIERMIQNGLLQELDKDKIPNLTHIGEAHMKGAQSFDPENAYAVPYTFGTVGIMYNTTMVSAEEVKSWNVLWDEKYNQSILMYERAGLARSGVKAFGVFPEHHRQSGAGGGGRTSDQTETSGLLLRDGSDQRFDDQRRSGSGLGLFRRSAGD